MFDDRVGNKYDFIMRFIHVTATFSFVLFNILSFYLRTRAKKSYSFYKRVFAAALQRTLQAAATSFDNFQHEVPFCIYSASTIYN
jgi:hypothetical protein